MFLEKIGWNTLKIFKFFFETCSEYSDLSSKSEILEQIFFAQYGLFHMKIAAAYEMIQL